MSWLLLAGWAVGVLAVVALAVGWIGQSIGEASGLTINDGIGRGGPSPLAPLFVAATSWGLAMFFTAKRRMALPSILLLLTFVGGVLVTAGFLLVQGIGPHAFDNNPQLGGVVGAVAAAGRATARGRLPRRPPTRRSLERRRLRPSIRANSSPT